MTDPRQIRNSDYDFLLPEERIAQVPLSPRDAAKLLVWDRGKLMDLGVRDAPDAVAQWGEYRLVINEAKVIPARIFMPRPSGIGHFELFYLDAEGLSVEQAMASRGSLRAWCKVRPQKKWKDGQVLEHEGGLRAERLKTENGVSLLQFSWPGSQTWAEILAGVGRIPLPPYMRRADTHEDRDRYQSVFARHEGSVAAPTASLHWTPELMNRWREVCADTQAVTLHVGAGTFQPLTAESIGDHTMHAEEVMISRSTLLALSDGKPVLAMGTTAARTIESLYWWAEQWKRLGIMPTYVDQWAPYAEGHTPSDSLAPTNLDQDALERIDKNSDRLDPEVSALLRWAALELEVLDQEVVSFRTALIIAPGYSFKVVKALITNFHQPQSTLLLLIAAGLGPVWRSIYEHALSHDYRFLSYGDANLYRW